MLIISLSSAVIDTLNKKNTASSKVGIAFLFCSHAERADQTIEELTGSLIQQLIMRQDVIPGDVHELYRSHNRFNTRPDYAELRKHLRSSVSRFRKVYIVVDALDECDESRKTRSSLLDLLRSLDTHVQLFFTSRRLGEIKSRLYGATEFEIRAQEKDMRKYLSAQIEREDNLVRLCKQDGTVRDEILHKIVAKADGMLVFHNDWLQ
jgi:hypothetical protein